jgi:hypothetical protein
MKSMLKLAWKGVQILMFIAWSPFFIIHELYKIVKKSNEKTREEKAKSKAEWVDWHNTKDRNIRNSKSVDFELSLYQALESIYIVDNSSNIKTVESRLVFLYNKLAEVERHSKLRQSWGGYLTKAVDKYNQSYYDRPIYELQTKMVTDPSFYLDSWPDFSDRMMCEALYRYANSQIEYMVSLKTIRSKENRILKVVEMVDELIVRCHSEKIKQRLEDLKVDLLKEISRLK